MGRVFHVMKKEFIQTFRDRRMVAIIFVAPIFQLFIFGYAVTTDIKNIELAVYDRDRSADSRRLVDAFFSSGYFNFAGEIDGDSQIEQALFEGRADVVIVIPTDYAKSLSRGQQAKVQLLLDASDSNFAQIAGSYSERVIASQAFGQLDTIMVSMAGRAAMVGLPLPSSLPSIDPKARIWYNPELKSAYYMVPGVICMLLMVVTMLLTGMAVTREREIGTIEQVIVSPIASWELILGKLAPFAILGFVDVALIVTVGTWHFGVPIHGSLALLFVASGLFLASTLGIGLYISTISATQQQAMFVTFLFIMPAILLSGFMFPLANMPEAIQYLTLLNPLRYFLVIIRGIFLKGNGMDVLWPQFAALAAFGVAIFGLASSQFSKRLT
jgi:drug efflux transport system permease protein